MMSHMISLMLIIGLIALPVLLAFFLRVNPTLVFASLLSGFMLAQFMTKNAGLVLNIVAPHAQTDQYTQIGLFIAPLILTLLLARRSSHSKLLLVQPIALVSSGLLLAALLQPLLPGGLQAQFLHTTIGNSIHSARDLIVGGSILANLVVIWFGHSSSSAGHSKKHH